MTLPVVLRPQAKEDVVGARWWYQRQRRGLGDEFAETLDRLLSRIATIPGSCPRVVGDVRRAKLPRFPYVVYYRTLPDRIEVIGVLHGRRDPRLWRERI